MCKRLVQHLNTNDILHDNQYAYRKKRSTELAVTKLTKFILNGFDENKLTIGVFLDLSRAFDCVKHATLIKKLKYYGIDGIALKWFTDYLNNRSQVVKYNNIYSDCLPVNAGVPQGSILGPILFLLYMNDIHNAAPNVNKLLFADDTLTFDQDVCYFELVKRINTNLEYLRKWFIANSLSINILKTETIVFSRKIVYYPLPPIIFNCKAIPFSHNVKFLGIYLDPKLSWKIHISHVKNKISSVCGVLNHIRGKISLKIAKMIYYAVAYSHFTYGNAIWSSASISNLTPLVLIQKRIIRIIARRGWIDHTLPIFKELNILTFPDICKLVTSSFVFKTLNSLLVSPIQFHHRQNPHYNLRNLTELVIPPHRSAQTKLFIHIRGAELWNSLPNNVRQATSYASFKRRIKTYLLSNYEER